MKAKERPILFSSPMVRALVEGRKTVTRRIVVPRTGIFKGGLGPEVAEIRPVPSGMWILRAKDGVVGSLPCPYGQPGDRLWVRETWKHIAHGRDFGVRLRFTADHAERIVEDRIIKDEWRTMQWKSRPSIHMPRWASRLSLEITGVKVERLQDITEQQAKAEGAPYWVTGHGPVSDSEIQIEPGYWGQGTYRMGFADLWESINGAGSWEANPWVWAVSFSRLSETAKPPEPEIPWSEIFPEEPTKETP